MPRAALALAVAALVAAGWHAPGQYVAIGAGMGAIGTGWIAYSRRAAPGLGRLAGAAAMTLGGAGVMLGVVRVVMALAAIAHVDRMLG